MAVDGVYSRDTSMSPVPQHPSFTKWKPALYVRKEKKKSKNLIKKIERAYILMKHNDGNND